MTYRVPDRSTIEVFAKHLAIAEALRETEVELSGDSDENKRDAASTAWSNMWQQLAQAREIAVQHGRDVTVYDSAYSRSAHYAIDPMDGYVLAPESRYAAEDAIEGLRSAFPGIVGSSPPRTPRTPRPLQTHAPYKIIVREPKGAAADARKIQTYQVSLCSPGYRDLEFIPARYDSAPIGLFGSRCVCCNAETEDAFEYEPATTPSTTVGRVRVPRCRRCVEHVAHGTAGEVLVAVGMGIVLVSVLLAFVSDPRFAIPGVASLLAMIVFGIRARAKARRLHHQGHYSRFLIFIRPKMFRLSTSNAILAREFVELNARPRAA